MESAEEQLLAPDPAQDAEPRDRVVGELGRAADLGTLVGLGPLERFDQRTDGKSEQRDSYEHDRAERDGGVQQDRGDSDEGHDAADEPGQDVEAVADLLHVARGDRDDLARADVRAQLIAEDGRLLGDQLLGATGRGDPVGDRHAVAQDSCCGLDRAEGQHQRSGSGDPRHVLVRGCLDRRTDPDRDGSLGDHPENTPGDAGREGAPLPPRHPPEEGSGRAEIGCPRVIEGEAGK